MTEREANSLEPHEQHLIKLFAKAFKQTEYYGRDHRIAREARDQLFQALRTLLEKQDELVYEITPSQIFLNQRATDKEDLQALPLAEGLYKKGISGIRFFKELTGESLTKFITVLTQEAVPPQGDPFWNLPGLTAWSLVLKNRSLEEENKEEGEEALRDLVHKMFSPVAPPALSGAEDLLEWAAQDPRHLVLAMEGLLQEQTPPDGSPAYTEKAKTLSSFLTGITKAYQVLLPSQAGSFLEKMALAITDMAHWEHIWFCEIDSSSSLFKTFYGLMSPDQSSQVLVQLILSLLTKGSRLVTFLKKCEGELTENREIMPEIKTQLEKVDQKQVIHFADLWSMVQGIFLDSEERQFMDDLYLKQLEGFSEILMPMNWEERSIPLDLRMAFEKLFPLEETEKRVSYLLELLISSKDIQDLIFWIKEMAGIAKELSLSGDFKHLAVILQEVSKAIASLPFHNDPSFPEVLSAWEGLYQVDYTEMLLNFFPTAREEDMPYLTALLPFLSEKTWTNLLTHMQEITTPKEEQKFLEFLLFGGKRVLPSVLTLLKDKPSPPFILKAFLIIAHLQAEEAIPLIPELLSYLSITEKAQAMKTLARLKIPEIAPILLPVLKKMDAPQRSEVVTILVREGNGPVLLHLLTHLRTVSRLARYSHLALEEKLIQALGKARYAPAIPLYHSILIERDIFPLGAYRKIKEAAGQGLKEIGTPEALEILDRERSSKTRLTRKISREVMGD
jgi:hypothetical protein